MTARFATMEDIALVDRICNDPSVRLWIAFDGAPARCVAAHYLTPPSAVVLVENGCFLLQAMGDGRFAVHANLLPAARQFSMVHAQAGLQLLADTGGFDELVATVPRCLPHSALLAKWLGFTCTQTLPRTWPVNGVLHDVDVLSLKLSDSRNRSEGDTSIPGDQHA